MIGTVLYVLSILLKLGIIPAAVLIYKKKITFLQGLFVGTFLFLASFGCQVYSANLTYGYSLIDSVVNEIFDTMLASYSVTAGLAAEEAALMQSIITSVRDMYFALFPCIMVCTNLMWAYFLLMLSKGLLALFKRDVSGFVRFCDFRMSRAGIFMGIVAYILSSFMDGSRVSLAFENLCAIIIFATFVCGFSLVDFKLRSRVRLSVVRFLIYVVLGTFLMMGIGPVVLVIIGVIDAFGDLRKPKKKINNDNNDNIDE